MSEELKLNDCKLCGGVDIEPTSCDDMDLHGGSAIYCVECGFSMDSIDSWNDLKVPIIATKDARIAELEQELAESRRDNLRQRVEDICFMEEVVPLYALDLRLGFGLRDKFNYTDNMTVDGIVDWLIEQGMDG